MTGLRALAAVAYRQGDPTRHDADGDGRLGIWAGGGASYRPARLKLVRDGTACTAYARTDTGAWQQIGAATVPSAAADEDDGALDAGMVAGAVDLDHPGRTTTAVFGSFSITD